ncbi:MAG: peptidase M17, partial [Desulfobulbaceae bacterium]|nr:peptidase M17 [Desulfobulbaceae bacterium]
MKLTVVQTSSQQAKIDLMVYFVRQASGKKAPVCGDKEVTAMVGRAFAAGDFCGKEGETFLYYPDGGGKTKAARVMVVGLGKEKLNREIIRKGAGSVGAFATRNKAARLMLVVPELSAMGSDEIGECLTEGVILGGYRFLKYKTKQDDDNGVGLIKSVSFYAGKSHAAAVRRGVKLGQAAATAACVARDMALEPGNFWTASHFADYGKQLAKNHGFTCKVLDKAAMKKLRMGGVLGVNQGSEEPPKMVILEYRTGKKVPTLMLVGKGLTFDSGGISLKPSAGMGDMKYDMCGGAAVLAAMAAVGEEKPKGIDV